MLTLRSSRGDVAAAAYRLRTTWRSRSTGLLSLLLLVSLVGGVSLASVAAARRTESSYPTFLASTNPSDLDIEAVSGFNGAPASYSAALTDALRRFPHVRHVESYVALPARLAGPGTVRERTLTTRGLILAGSVDGLLFNQDRFTVTAGHMADPARADEVVATQTAAQVLGLHVGSVLRLRVGTDHSVFRLTVVGIGQLNREVVEDQIARLPTYIVATPALTRQVLSSSQLTYYGVQLDGGTRYIPAVERAFLVRSQAFTDFQVASLLAAQAEQSIRPEALALGVFGGIAGAAAVLLALQVISRQIRLRRDDFEVLRALGAGRAAIVFESLLGIVAAVVIGTVLASVIAFFLSPIGPLGPARSVDPTPGLSADWAVIGLGGLALIAVLTTAAVVIARRNAPHRLASRDDPERPSAIVQWVGQSRLPAPAVAGVRFALLQGRGRTSVPSRWTMVAAVVAVVVIVSTLTFGNSLQTLVAQPRLYGWNWTLAVQSSDGYGPVPNSAARLLSDTHGVAAWSGVWFSTMLLDGVEVPVLLGNPGAAVAPPIIAGHGLAARNQIVLGATTLAQLHKHVGDTVALQFVPGGSSNPVSRPVTLRIVGVATMPAIGIAEDLHTSMGVGALVPADADFITEQLGPLAYPGCEGFNMVFIRLRPGEPAPVAASAADRVVAAANTALDKATGQTCAGNVASTLPVQRPAQIVNYRSIGSTPLLLAAALALGAVGAFGLALVTSIRRKRHDIAVLKALGFTPGQVTSAVIWQATVPAVVGIVLGIPLGIALGRWLWTLFAQQIGAVAAPAVPVAAVILTAVATVALANLVAIFPGLRAAETPTGLALREE